jgi:Mlc titration factor MtfA (ptsG expression regulator)
MAFAFNGDVTGRPQADIPSVTIWSQDYFHQMDQLRVCTQLVHDQALAVDPAIAIVGPFVPADAAGTDVRRVRWCA